MLGRKQVNPVFSIGRMVLINVHALFATNGQNSNRTVHYNAANHTSPHGLTADTLDKSRMGSSLCISPMNLILGIENVFRMLNLPCSV